MSDWPPKPQNDNINQPQTSGQQTSGQEWQILEKVVLASVEEQRRSRKWGIVFKGLTFLYIFIVLGIGGGSALMVFILDKLSLSHFM